MLEIRNLNARAGGRMILHDISLRLTPHSFTALIGKNGSGKSTLASCINQQQPSTGEILYSGRDLRLMRPRERAALVSFLPQMLPAPALTVHELVRMGRSPYVDIGRRLTPGDESAVRNAMAAAGVDALADRRVDHLSGGERQRAFLAMTLAQDARLMMLDEPTAHMDMACEGEFLHLLDELRRSRKKTLLVIMHDLNQALRSADRIILLDGGRIRFSGDTAACLQSQIIEQIFGVERIQTERGPLFLPR